MTLREELRLLLTPDWDELANLVEEFLWYARAMTLAFVALRDLLRWLAEACDL